MFKEKLHFLSGDVVSVAAFSLRTLHTYTLADGSEQEVLTLHFLEGAGRFEES